MIDVYNEVVGIVCTNCYIVVDDVSHAAVIIDPGDCAETIIARVNERDAKVKGIFITHGHFDHIKAAEELSLYFDVPIYAGTQEKDLLVDSKLNAGAMFGNICTVEPDVLLDDHAEVEVEGMRFQVIHTPGHTVGGVCYYLEEYQMLFSGDTLFKESIGRTDLPTGGIDELIDSIRTKLYGLPDKVRIYPGHGESSTILYEKQNNPYVAG